MSFLIFANDPAAREARRSLLGKSGVLLAKKQTLAKDIQSIASDFRTLNTALGAQRAAIVDERLHSGSTAPQTRTSKWSL